MSTKRERIEEILSHASDADIHITYLPNGSMRVDFDPYKALSPTLVKWKQALKNTRGLWADRQDIEEEMQTIRSEYDRSFSA